MNHDNLMSLSTRIDEAIAAAKINRADGVLRRVKILGRESANGRTYTPEAMQQAARLYEGMKVNLDHADAGGGIDRSVAARLGVLRNVAVEAAGVFGDLHLLMAHPLANLVIEAAEKMPETLGLSHSAEGRVRRENGAVIVESVHKVHSVDLVQTPATVAGLFESLRSESDSALRREFAQLAEEVVELRRLVEQLQQNDGAAEHARQLLESRGCEATAVRIRSLVRCDTEAERQSLLETWDRQSPLGDRPLRSPSILDADGQRYTATDGASLARLLR